MSMPKIVKRDDRRDEILSATWRVIARDGIAKATIRSIAREAHCSPGILAHYFDDKADILGSALVLSRRRVAARMQAKAAGRTGLDALRVVMLEALPLDDERDLEAQIEISFWGGRAAIRSCARSSTPNPTASRNGCAPTSRKRGN
jgi:AcrR family transcriptional regulator